MKIIIKFFPSVVVFLSPTAHAAGAGAPHLNGADLPLWWTIPFVGILLSIAIFPLGCRAFLAP